jgi:cytochrome c oxidase cbb3-type subunit 2
MAGDGERRYTEHPPPPQGYQREGPRRRMLMTPQMVAFGGLIAFLTVVLLVVVLPTGTYDVEESENWLPLSDAAARGRGVYLSNGCVYCHSGFSRPQDVFNGALYLYPRASEPGDYVGIEQSPNTLGTARTGPDLSQEGGNHPTDWHAAHYDNPRGTNPLSIMPQFGFLSEEELTNLIAFNQSQGGKEALLRTVAVDVGEHLMRINGGGLDPADAFPDLVSESSDAGDYHADGMPSDQSPSGLPWKLVWHMNSFERSYWLTTDPLPVTQQNLMRGREVFQQRCTGCHGQGGMGDGPAAEFLMPRPFDFTGPEAMGPGASDGQMYHRILTGGPGTAMENFGTRLSVEDIWRVVLFLRTIPNGGLDAVPTPDMYEYWTPNDAMLSYIENHPLSDVAPDARDDPFLAAALFISPGMRMGDEPILVGGKLPMTLERLRDLLHDEYMRRVQQIYEEATNRGDDLPPLETLMETSHLEFHAP